MDASRPDPRPHAAIVGAGIGGLAAAMRLGAKGYRVTVLDRLDGPGGRGSAIRRGGHRFDLGPTIVTVPQDLRDLWAACGRDFDADVDLRPLDPFYEIRWPDGSRFKAHADHDAMREEVRRLSPADVAGWERFLRDAERRYHVGFEGLGRRPMHEVAELLKALPDFARLRADRSIAAHVARRVRDPRLRMALSFHPLFIGGDPFRVTSMYALVSHLEATFGVHYAIGGVEAIARAMVRVVEAQGGTVRQGAEVDEILVDRGRARALRLASGQTVAAEIIVSNADAGHTYDRLLRRRPKRRWSPRKLARSRWSMGLFVWYFGTSGTAGMWRDVGHHTILNGPRYEGLCRDIFRSGRLSEDFSLYIHRPSVTEPGCAPDGGDTFYVLSPVPHLGHGGVDWATTAEPYRQRLAAAVEAVMPGIGAHVRESFCFTPGGFPRSLPLPAWVRFLDRAADPAVGLVPPAQRERGGARACTSWAPGRIPVPACPASWPRRTCWASSCRTRSRRPCRWRRNECSAGGRVRPGHRGPPVRARASPRALRPGGEALPGTWRKRVATESRRPRFAGRPSPPRARCRPACTTTAMACGEVYVRRERRMTAADDLEFCRASIRTGSLSFHAASKLLPPKARDPALALYAFCRLADDAVDEGGAEAGRRSVAAGPARPLLRRQAEGHARRPRLRARHRGAPDAAGVAGSAAGGSGLGRLRPALPDAVGRVRVFHAASPPRSGR